MWRASSTTRMRKAAEICGGLAKPWRPNSDIKNLELEHGHVSLSLQVLTKNCDAFDPPIDAAASIGVGTALVPQIEAALFFAADYEKSLRGL